MSDQGLPSLLASFFAVPVARRRRETAERRAPGVKTDTTLRFYHEVLGLEHLHYGLWDEGDPLDRRGLARAQHRYVDKLVGWIPAEVESILDVGCGVGGVTERLCREGYEVEGMSPDPYQREVFRRRLDVPFHLVRFPDFEPARTYDLLLMSESAQYIWLDGLFPVIRRAAAGGWLLLADYFIVDPETAPDESGHRLDAFLAGAEEVGLELLRRDDVTAATAPTLEVAEQWIESYVLPTIGIVGDRYPRTSRLVRRLLPRRKVNSLRRTVDPEAYRRGKRYLFLLYRVPA